MLDIAARIVASMRFDDNEAAATGSYRRRGGGTQSTAHIQDYASHGEEAHPLPSSSPLHLLPDDLWTDHILNGYLDLDSLRAWSETHPAANQHVAIVLRRELAIDPLVKACCRDNDENEGGVSASSLNEWCDRIGRVNEEAVSSAATHRQSFSTWMVSALLQKCGFDGSLEKLQQALHQSLVKEADHKKIAAAVVLCVAVIIRLRLLLSNDQRLVRWLAVLLFGTAVRSGLYKQQQQQGERRRRRQRHRRLLEDESSSSSLSNESASAAAAPLKRSRSVADALHVQQQQVVLNNRSTPATLSESTSSSSRLQQQALHTTASTPNLLHLMSQHSSSATLAAATEDSGASRRRSSDPLLLLEPTSSLEVLSQTTTSTRLHTSSTESSAVVVPTPPRPVVTGCVGAYRRARADARDSFTQSIRIQRQTAFDALSETEQSHYSTALLDACTSDATLATVQALAERVPLDNVYLGSDGTASCALHTAAFFGATQVCEYLVRPIVTAVVTNEYNAEDDENSNSNNDNRSGIVSSNDDPIEAAAGGGVNVHTVDANGWTALHFCAGSDQAHTAACLVRLGADTTVRALNGYTPVQWADRLRHVRTVAALHEAQRSVLTHTAATRHVHGNGSHGSHKVWGKLVPVALCLAIVVCGRVRESQ